MNTFDALSDRVQTAAGMIGALGYLNSDGGQGLELRFQMRPPTSLWDGRPMGFSQRFRDASLLSTYLDKLEAAAREHQPSLEAGDPDALERVLASALAALRG